MIATITFAFELDELLDALDLELTEDDEYEIDEDGVLWRYDVETETDYYFDEDLDDWAEVDEDGTCWYLDEEEGIYYCYDHDADEWVEYI
jgi:hypothetical protein